MSTVFSRLAIRRPESRSSQKIFCCETLEILETEDSDPEETRPERLLPSRVTCKTGFAHNLLLNKSNPDVRMDFLQYREYGDLRRASDVTFLRFQLH